MKQASQVAYGGEGDLQWTLLKHTFSSSPVLENTCMCCIACSGSLSHPGIVKYLIPITSSTKFQLLYVEWTYLACGLKYICIGLALVGSV